MVTVQDVYRRMDEMAPFSSQMSFDNSGHLVGDLNQTVERILVSLDITQEVVAEAAAQNCQLILSHHPVIFGGVKRLTMDDPTGRILIAMVKENISAICCHTNADMAEGGVNDCLAEAVGLEELEPLSVEGAYEDGTPYSLGRIGMLRCGPCSLQDYLGYVLKQLKPNGIRYVDCGKEVHRVAVGGGACGEYMDLAIAKGCDTFITSDLKYHSFLDGKAKGINLIDAGHFPTENLVCPRMEQWIREAFPELQVLQTKTHREVFSYYIQAHTEIR